MAERKDYSVIILWIMICAIIAIAIPSLFARKYYVKLMQKKTFSFPEVSPVPLYIRTHTIKIDLSHPRAISKGVDDTFLVAGDNMLVKYNMDGKEIMRFRTDEPVQCIATDTDGTIFAGYKNRVVVLAPDCRFVSEMPELGEKAYLTSLAVTSNHVFSADYGNRIVWCFDKTGKLSGKIDGVTSSSPRGFILPSPYFDIAAAPDGNLWIVNPGLLRLQKHTPAGGLVSTWGKPSPSIEDFCGCCNPAHIAVGENGFIVTSEKGIPRIKVYDETGRFTGVVTAYDKELSGIAGMDIAIDSNGRILVLDGKACAVHIFVSKAGKKTEQ
jgi:hypothetical protein